MPRLRLKPPPLRAFKKPFFTWQHGAITALLAFSFASNPTHSETASSLTIAPSTIDSNHLSATTASPPKSAKSTSAAKPNQTAETQPSPAFSPDPNWYPEALPEIPTWSDSTTTAANSDTLPFPEVIDSLVLSFPYRPEFMSLAWDSTARAWAKAAAAAAAKAKLEASGPLPIAQMPSPLRRDVRVLLRKASPVLNGAARGGFAVYRVQGNQIIPEGLRIQGRFTLRSLGRDLEITSDAGKKRLRETSALRLAPVTGGSIFEIEGIPYRGALEIFKEGASAGFIAVNALPLEDYLRGVLPYELGRVDEKTTEALKALAVVARTYALRRLMRPAGTRFDLYADVQDQVYKGMKDEYALSDAAIQQTRGQVLLYNDTLIVGFYHSTCGGMTANREEVWEGDPAAYLVARSDLDSNGKPWCAGSPLLEWSQSWSPSALSAILKRNFATARAQGPTNFDRITKFTIEARARCGRIARLRIDTDEGPVFIRGDKVRWGLKPIRQDGRILESANFNIGFEGQQIVARGRGFGHGVGLCQWGAMGRARAGQNYRTILTAYYTQTRLVEYR